MLTWRMNFRETKYNNCSEHGSYMYVDIQIMAQKYNASLKLSTIIKQGDSDSEVILCFGTKFKLLVDLKLLKVITVVGFTLRHRYKRLVE